VRIKRTPRQYTGTRCPKQSARGLETAKQIFPLGNSL